MCASRGHCGAHLEQLVDLLLVLDDREGDLGVADREDDTRRPPRPGRAAPGSRRATAPRASPRRGAAGSRRSRRGARRAAGRPRPGRRRARARAPRARSRSASARCRSPSRAAPAPTGGGAAWSSSRRGKVGDTINLSNEGERTRRALRVSRDSRKILTPSCRSADNLRDNTLRCIPRPEPPQALIETVPVKLDTAVSSPPDSGRTTSIR